MIYRDYTLDPLVTANRVRALVRLDRSKRSKFERAELAEYRFQYVKN